MPTIYKYRSYCTTCQDYKLFVRELAGREDRHCVVCDSVHEPVELSQIPVEKIEQQRKRYKEQQRSEFRRMMSFATSMGSFMMTPGSDVRIVEDDAGQIEIDAKERMTREEKYRNNLIEIDKYRNLGNNDKCICGSDIKYKKCCQERINSLKFDPRQ